jgi:hypothetical protein
MHVDAKRTSVAIMYLHESLLLLLPFAAQQCSVLTVASLDPKSVACQVEMCGVSVQVQEVEHAA